MSEKFSEYTLQTGGLLYKTVADALRNYIAVKKLKPGDKLPSERDLCALFGASRSSVREALRHMQSEGVITVAAGRGSFLSDEKSIGTILRQVKTTSLDELEIKMLLETQIIRHAIRQASPSQLALLLEYAEEMNRINNQGVFPKDLDQKFHFTLSGCTSNHPLRNMARRMAQSLSAYWFRYYDKYWYQLGQFEKMVRSTVPYHAEIVRALSSHNEAGAIDAYMCIYRLDIQMFDQVRD